MTSKSKAAFLILTGTICISSISYAAVNLPAILGDHMVLQQKENVTVWGWAEPGEKVTVKGSWQWFEKATKADENGKWKVKIRTLKAGGPHTLTVKGTNEIVLDDVLIGEVWVGSGQSNMEMPLAKMPAGYSGIKNALEEIADANHPDIRLFQVGDFSSKEPLDDVEAGVSQYGIPPATCKWQTCDPETIPTFSATAYFFARQLHQNLGVAVGIIDASWGATAAEAWTPASGLEVLGLQDELKHTANSPQQADQKNIPTRLYNGMIHPLRNLRIKGVIWYQGESNTQQADKYCGLFSTMIAQWRDAFGYEFPFYFVQIAPYGGYGVNAAYLREAQFETMLSVPRTGMAVTMDLDNTDIHPKNKQEVGRRLALWALANEYGQKDLVCSGPLYKSMKIKGNDIRLSFDYTGSGLTASDGGPLTHFRIAGADRKFVNATAIIDDDTVVVSSNDVSSPVAVRFAFTSAALPNLCNEEGLPASSFRTDDWPLE